MPFLHAIWGAELFGKQVALIGNRQGDRELLALYHDGKGYVVDVLDAGAGPANCMHFRIGDSDMVFAANRETDEVALYTLYE